MSTKTRLERLYLQLQKSKSSNPETTLLVSEVLKAPDDERLAAYFAAAHRAGLLNAEPRHEDDSPFADFVRVARRIIARTE